MPDTEISKLPPLTAAQLRAEDVLAIADVSLTETKKVRADDLVLAGLSSVPDNSIDPNKLDWSILDSNSISGDDIARASIADEKLIANTLTARSIAPGAIGSSELADGAVDTDAVKSRAITGGKIALSTLNSNNIVDGGIDTDALRAGSVTFAKLSLNDGELNGTLITGNTVGTDQLANELPGNIIVSKGINTAQLADEACETRTLATDAVTTSKISDLAITSGKISSVGGAKINDGTVPAKKFTSNAFGRGLDNDGANVGITNSVTAATGNGISWDSQGLITGFTSLEGTDLPIATDSTIGGISVPASSGLSVSGVGAIDHSTSITAGTTSGITFDEHGHITSTAEIAADDLPPATSTRLGAVSVPTANDNPLAVNGDGELRHANVNTEALTSLVSVNVDVFGHVSSGNSTLLPEQVPGLDAEIITTGQFPSNVLPRSNNKRQVSKLFNFVYSRSRTCKPNWCSHWDVVVPGIHRTAKNVQRELILCSGFREISAR